MHKHCIPIESGGCLCAGGPEYRIRVRGKVYVFEWNRYCGPIFLNRDGGQKMSGITKRHWGAVQAWVNKGKRVGGDGLCVWEAEIVSLGSTINEPE